MNKADFIFSGRELTEYLRERGVSFDMPDVTNPFFLLIPKYYVDLIDWTDASDPLRKMVLTSNLEQDIKKYEVTDPIGDRSHSPVPGIVHRYPDRCLLNLTNICAVHCRFCFRKNLLDSHVADYTKSIEYIASRPEIWEVILSGGDPFMLTDYFLEQALRQLKTIPHVKTIRFHTRTPAVYPARVTKEFIRVIKQAAPLTIVIHINHPREITSQFIQTIETLRSTGAILLSQTVLMKNINDSAATLTLLFKSLIESGVKPYYLHHLDAAEGTHHFRVSLTKGKTIMRQLRGVISGICIPEYVIDTPGGHGKIPVFWFTQTDSNTYTATNFQGKTIQYTDHAGIDSPDKSL